MKRQETGLETSVCELQTELASVQVELSSVDTVAVARRITVQYCVTDLKQFILIANDENLMLDP
jgi:hypothetical protein